MLFKNSNSAKLLFELAPLQRKASEPAFKLSFSTQFIRTESLAFFDAQFG